MIPVYDDGSGNKERPGGNPSDSSDDIGNTHGGGTGNSYDGNLWSEDSRPENNPTFIGHW